MVMPIYPIETEKILLRRKPRFLHKQKLNLVMDEMYRKIEQFKEDADDSEKYEDLVKCNSILINFPVKNDPPSPSWSLYNTFTNLLNYHS